MNYSLIEKLDSIERLAKASKFQRLRSNPVRYLLAILFRRFIYPLTRKEIVATTPTFFRIPMKIALPASIDIYLMGGKPHHSELRLARFLINNLQPGDEFIDVGAHFGYFSLLAAALVQENGKVFAFEASPNTFQILQQNCADHHNIQASHYAISNSNENITFINFLCCILNIIQAR